MAVLWSVHFKKLKRFMSSSASASYFMLRRRVGTKLMFS
jgi:hypothetical protein